MKSLPDFHVGSLEYALRSSEHCSYVNPPPLHFETDDARFQMAAGKLTCEMKTHFSTAEAARAVVEPLLRAWEVDADLRWNRGELRFQFTAAGIIDRSPVQPGLIRGTAFVVQPAAMVFAIGTVSAHATRAQYPHPPASFRLNPDAQSILDRYCGYLDGREPLLAMAYFCLTVVEVRAGGKTRKERRACSLKKYRIAATVLDKMGELTTEHGNELNKRKASATRPLTGSETAWLEAAVKQLIWRLGDTRTGAALPEIKMSDLPPL